MIADGVAGRPAEPVRLGACSYGAWSGGGGTVVTVCGDSEPRVVSLGTPTSDLVFRVNRDQILLNDRTTGMVWNIDSEEPTRLDDWDAFKRKPTEDDEKEEQQEEEQGDQRPPVANPDTLVRGPRGPRSCTRSTTTPRPVAGCCRSARSTPSPARAAQPRSAPTGRRCSPPCRRGLAVAPASSLHR